MGKGDERVLELSSRSVRGSFRKTCVKGRGSIWESHIGNKVVPRAYTSLSDDKDVFSKKGDTRMKHLKKLLICMSAVLLLAASLPLTALAADEDESGEQSLLDEIKERGVLVVGTSPDFPPNEFIDSTKSGQDQYVGSDIE